MPDRRATGTVTDPKVWDHPTMREAAVMPSITKKSKVAMADKVIGRAGSLDPEQVKAEARAFADRVLKRAMKGEAYPSDVWVNAYIRKWRSLSGLHSRSVPGPKPVWLPATSLDAARHARRRSA